MSEYYAKPVGQHQRPDKLVVLFAVLIAVFLNQANTVMGINFSFSDVFCALLTIYLIFKNQFKLLRCPTVYYVILIVHTLFTSLFYVPAHFMFLPRLSSVIVDSLKLMVVFIYFTLGYSLSLLEVDEPIVKWYSIAAFCIGLLGGLLAAFQIRFLTDAFFFGGSRLRGLMNDPNYFSIVQISAFVYFTRQARFKPIGKACIQSVLLFSILASGSKTGLITLIVYLIFRMAETLFQKRIEAGTLVSGIFVLMASALLLLNPSAVTEKMTRYLSSLIPAFDRLQLVFTDFGNAVSGMGSQRDETWTVAVNLIQRSPIFGIGLGTYSGLAKQLYGTSSIAHNIYLQLFSEWGVLPASILFTSIFLLIGGAVLRKKMHSAVTIITRDILIVFLTGSLAISLNNARMFWIFFGIFVSNVTRIREASTNVCESIYPHGHLQL
ncbi:MAG TPA: O-antigen ligase family protein [Clostridiales bacterium]|nr:O-antigen ligase family protein [Clostridiales bacterium]